MAAESFKYSLSNLLSWEDSRKILFWYTNIKALRLDIMTKIKDIPSALILFEEAASKQATATEQGDYKTGNKCYATIVQVTTFLKEQGEISSLSNLLNHDAIGVRMWTATYLLPILEEEGISVLEQIAEQPGIHSLTATTTLSEWRKGNLKL